MISVLIADDHVMLRKGISALLNGSNDIFIAGECNDGNEVLAFLAKEKVDVILMDINLPNMNGIETTIAVLEKYPSVKKTIRNLISTGYGACCSLSWS